MPSCLRPAARGRQSCILRARMDPRLVSVVGAFAMLGLAFALCPRERRKHVNLRTVGRGLVVLVGIAVLVLRTPVRSLFEVEARPFGETW